MIYFILGKHSHRIKIGFSKNAGEVDTRFHYLRRDNADDLELLGRVEGDFEYERSLHSEVESYRAHNEWFDASPDVVDLVARELNVSAATISERLPVPLHIAESPVVSESWRN